MILLFCNEKAQSYLYSFGFSFFVYFYIVPSEQVIVQSVATPLFQLSPFVIAFHCSFVPSKMMFVSPVQP